MSTIKQLLLLHQQDNRIKTIARTLGISKNTVRGYLEKLDALQHTKDIMLSIKEMVQLPEPELEAIFHAGNPAYKDDRYTYIKDRIEYFANELKRTGVNRRSLWQEYRVQYPDGYGYTHRVG